MGVSVGGRDDDGGIGREIVLGVVLRAFSQAGPLLPGMVMRPTGMTKPQMQQNPHLAGFVLLRIWWSRGDLNPRPPVLRCRYYMRSRVY